MASRVTWIVEERPSRVDGELRATLASVRYRAVIPGLELRRRGHDVRFLAAAETAPATLLDIAPDVAVVSKSFSEDGLRLALAAIESGARLVVDVCDDHFRHARLGPHLSGLLTIADTVTASTAEMARRIAQTTGKRARVIPDPYEGVRRAGRFEPDDRLRLLWFGHPSNLDTLLPWLPRLIELGRRRPLGLEVVTAADRPFREHCERLSASLPDGLALTLTSWSLEATARALADCDLVLLPTLDRPDKAVKSANRLVESLWAGRLPVAQSSPAYRAWSDVAWVGEDLVRGLLWAVGHRDEVRERIARGQIRVGVELSPAMTADAWARALELEPLESSGRLAGS